MLFGILLTIQVIVSVCMGGLILIQRSEGGALGMGGGPSGFMSARGAGNLLTRLTAILATVFFANCIGLTIAGNLETANSSAVDKVDTNSLTVNRSTQPAVPAAAAASTSSAPSLSDLPIAGAPVAAPSSSVSAPAVRAPASASRSSSAPLVMPAPLKLPSSSSSQASNTFSASSSASKPAAASSSSAPKPVASSSAAPAAASTTSSPQ